MKLSTQWLTACLLATCPLFTALANAQSEWRNHDGSADFDVYGETLARLDDVNGDGILDYAIGAPSYLGDDFVTVYSGLTGGALYSVGGSFPIGRSLTALGDLNGDGIGEFATALLDWDLCNCAAPVRVFSGADGSLVYEWVDLLFEYADSSQFGRYLSDAGDIDGDGVSDVAVSAPGWFDSFPNRGLITVFSGATGLRLWMQDGSSIVGETYFHQTAPLGDVNDDGKADLAVRVHRNTSGTQVQEKIVVLSGQDGAPLFYMTPSTGQNIRTIGSFGRDANGDGALDLIVTGIEMGNTTFIALYSAKDGSVLLEQTGLPQSFHSFADAGLDLSGDGVGDVLLTNSDQTLEVRSGVDLEPIYSIGQIGGGSTAGILRGAILGDLNGDSRADILASNTNDVGQFQGRATVFTGSDPIGTVYCQGAVPNVTGLPGVLEVVGSPVVSDQWVSLTAFQLPQNTFAYFVSGSAQEFTPGAGGSVGTLCVGGQIGRFNQSSEILFTGLEGRANLGIDLNALPSATGPMPAQVGQTVNFQLWYRDTSVSSSNFTSAVSLTWE